MPAVADTNLTIFVHSNMVQCTQAGTNSGGGGSGDPPPPPSSASGFGGEDLALPSESEPERPPYPWEAQAWSIMSEVDSSSLLGSGSAGGDGPLGPLDDGSTNSGFYRVVRTGIHIVGLTNNPVLQGDVEIPLELGATNENIPGMHLYADGIAVPMCTVDIPGNRFPVARWNTAFMRNGTYSLHAECDFAGSAEVLIGVTNSVTVSNSVTFTEFDSMFGEQMWVYAELSMAEAQFEIDMFTGTNFIGTFSGNTTNGQISFLWDLVDPSSQSLTNSVFEGAFYVAAAAGNPRTNSPVRRKWYKDYNFPGDYFVVAWAITKVNPLAPRVATLMQNGVVDILASPAANDPYQLSPGNSYSGSSFRLLSSTKTNLMSYLSDPSYRNFYFYGHGNASSIGDYNPAQGWLASITETELRSALTNYGPTGTNLHSYRFVFLDSCKSANGSLCEAFGIAKHQVHRQWYQDYLKIMPRAFVGYLETDIDLPSTASEHQFNADMLAQLLGQWRDGASLHGIVEQAKQHQFWSMDPSAIIWGATNLYRYY
jgi:hypothetical protein